MRGKLNDWRRSARSMGLVAVAGGLIIIGPIAAGPASGHLLGAATMMSGDTSTMTGAPAMMGADDLIPEVETESEHFIHDMYEMVLGRSPELSEIEGWDDSMHANPSFDSARSMVHAFFDSGEALARSTTPWSYIWTLYGALLGRPPMDIELSEWVHGYLDTIEPMVDAFLESPEFSAVLPSTVDDSAVRALVTRLYEEALRRPASADDLDRWAQYVAVTGDVDWMVKTLLSTMEYLVVPRRLDDHVTVLYRALLGRAPAPSEVTAWRSWLVAQLGAIEDVFARSGEFEHRFRSLFPSTSGSGS